MEIKLNKSPNNFTLRFKNLLFGIVSTEFEAPKAQYPF